MRFEESKRPWDEWKWSMDISDSFKVCTLSRRIQNLLLADHSVGNHHLWNSWIPRKVWSWWDMVPPVVFPSFNISDIARGIIDPFANSRIGKIQHGVFQTLLCAIMEVDNRIVVAPADTTPKIKEKDIFPSIQRLSRTWNAARSAFNQANWDVWIYRPYDLFS
ncbi:hypothetical protein Tco_1358854 [Tanacetum coccineum]